VKSIKIKVEDVEYSVDVPAYMIPVINFMAPALGKIPGSLKEAVEASKELEEALRLFTERCVSPTPRREHVVELVFKAIAHVTQEINRAVKAANFYGGAEASGIR